MLSSHRMEEVEHICDHVTIIHEGSIVASGKPSDLASTDHTIEVQCSDAKEAAGVLAELDGLEKVEVTAAERLTIHSAGIKTSRINSFLVERGIKVDQVIQRRESLEQVFFRLTGAAEEGREHAE